MPTFLIEPADALALADTLLSSFHEVEKLTVNSRYDSHRVALLLAGARDALEDAIRLEHPMKPSGNETNLSAQWIHMLMVRDIGQLSRFKSELVGLGDNPPRTVQTLLCVLLDLNSLLSSPTMIEPLKKHFDAIEGVS